MAFLTDLSSANGILCNSSFSPKLSVLLNTDWCLMPYIWRTTVPGEKGNRRETRCEFICNLLLCTEATRNSWRMAQIRIMQAMSVSTFTCTQETVLLWELWLCREWEKPFMLPVVIIISLLLMTWLKLN